jgi:2-polyprenyl-3-methyl-5-hydroxy-6-metoxy-1,4-benzoquinol methylase
MPKKSNCPLCQSIAYFYSSYPGKFFSCNELLKCSDCKLIFANKLPSKDNLNKYYSSGLFYDQVANPFNTEILEFSLQLSRSRLKLIFAEGQLNNGTQCLDIGAGNGQFGVALHEMDRSAKYDCVEPDNEVRAKIQNLTNNQYSDIDEIKAGGYDLAVMNQVLEHVPDPVDFVESVTQLLSKSGYIYIDVPYKDFLFKPSVVPHILFWTQKSISYLIEKIGFQMIYCNTVGMPHSKAKLFFNQKTIFSKLSSPWSYANKINKLTRFLGIPPMLDTFSQFEADQYGGERQWLRCIAQKTD